MQYCEKLRELRENHDLTQADLANALNISRQYYGNYERGINEIPLRHIITLCNFYNVSADYILGLPKGLDYPQR